MNKNIIILILLLIILFISNKNYEKMTESTNVTAFNNFVKSYPSLLKNLENKLIKTKNILNSKVSKDNPVFNSKITIKTDESNPIIHNKSGTNSRVSYILVTFDGKNKIHYGINSLGRPWLKEYKKIPINKFCVLK